MTSVAHSVLAVGALNCLLPFIGTAAATERDWTVVATGADGTTFSIDMTSKVVRGTNVQAWILVDYTAKRETEAEAANAKRERELAERGMLSCNGTISLFCQPGMSKPRSEKQLRLFDCSGGRTAVSVSVKYHADGHVISSEETKAPVMATVIPDSVGEQMMRAVCSVESRTN